MVEIIIENHVKKELILKRIAILGSTGSIGKQALDIISESNRYKIFALTCNKQSEKIVEQALLFKPKYVAVYDEASFKEVKEKLAPYDIEVLFGMEGLIEVATHPDVDVVLTSVVGNIGLLPTVKAIEAHKTIALANKETLVTAGEIIMPLAKEKGVSILPVDSEHSAIFQCLNGEAKGDIEKLILTASGGAFRGLSRNEINLKRAGEALKHPNWSMGAKITIDSATLMNKGLEFIEARWLFDVKPKDIDVLIHPQSIIHSMVQFKDSSVIAQMGYPDMRLPIIYALDYPSRYENKMPRLDFSSLKSLTFGEPDYEKFPCLKIAIEALNMGGYVPTIMNAANEVLVSAYLENKIGFYDISDMILKAISSFKIDDTLSVDKILEVDYDTRKLVDEWIKRKD